MSDEPTPGERLAAYERQRAELGFPVATLEPGPADAPDPLVLERIFGPCPWCGQPAIPGHGRPADAEPGDPGPCDEQNGSFMPGEHLRVHYKWAVARGWRVVAVEDRSEFVTVEVPR